MTMTAVLSEELVKTLRDLLRQESETLFAQGDLLVANPLDDAQMAALAREVGVKVTTLRLREKVSREVPKSKRQVGTPWSVYRELIRIENPDERWTIHDSRPEWTVGAMQKRVADARGAGRGAGIAARGGCRVGSVDIKAELVDGVLKIVVKTGESLEDARFLEISGSEGMLVARVDG